MSLYLQAIDNAIRSSFFSPKADLKRLVDELKDDSSLATMLDVILHSLLQDGALVKAVWSPTQKPGVVDLDSQELRRTGDLMKQMGTVALSKATGYLEAPFEEDVMRVVILESFGGTDSTEKGREKFTTQSSAEWYSSRNVTAGRLKYRLETGTMSVPLVRGFAFAGGLGGNSLAHLKCRIRQTAGMSKVDVASRSHRKVALR
jgi:hypothetical protein